MQLTEQHVINKNDPCFAAIDAAAFASKTCLTWNYQHIHFYQ